MDNFSKDFKKAMNSIKVPEDRLYNEINTVIEKKKTRKTLKQKFYYASTAAALGVSILIGSAFISPVIADTMAKIPVIGSIFEKEDPIDMVAKLLEEENYQYNNLGIHYQPKQQVSITVASSQYLQKNGNQIKELVEKALLAEGYDAYDVKVNVPITFSEEEADYIEALQKDRDKVYEALIAEGYKQEQLEIRYIDERKLLTVYLIGSKSYFTSKKEEVRLIVEQSAENTVFNYETLEVKHSDEPLVKVISHDSLPEYQQLWRESEVLSFIHNELYGKKAYHVSDVGQKMENGTLYLDIYLSLPRSDSTINEITEGIKKNIITIIESERFKDKIDGLPYEISFYSEEKVKIE